MIIDNIHAVILLQVYCFKILSCLALIAIVILVAVKIWLKIVQRSCTCQEKLNGKIALVTGGNAGIGFATAKILAKRGAKVVIASRNVEKSKAAAADIIEATGNPDVEVKHLDLNRLSSVKQFGEDFNRSYDRLDILINNAAVNSYEKVLTEDGIEKVMQVNHVGPTYLTKLLLDKVEASKPSRIVFVSSDCYKLHQLDPNDPIGASAPNSPFIRYANSKFCNILTAKALTKRVPEGVTVNAVHPGSTDSEIFEPIPSPLVKKILLFVLRYFFRTAEECAQTTVHVATAPSLARVSGQYFVDCQVIEPWRSVSEELADRVWDDSVRIAGNKVYLKNVSSAF